MKEIRVCEIRADAAAAGAAKVLKLEGRPIVYDQPTTINDPAGTFIEIIRAGALDHADLSDARLFYNHDLNKVPLARTPKTMQLTLDAAGLSWLQNYRTPRKREAFIRQYSAAIFPECPSPSKCRRAATATTRRQIHARLQRLKKCMKSASFRSLLIRRPALKRDPLLTHGLLRRRRGRKPLSRQIQFC